MSQTFEDHPFGAALIRAMAALNLAVELLHDANDVADPDVRFLDHGEELTPALLGFAGVLDSTGSRIESYFNGDPYRRIATLRDAMRDTIAAVEDTDADDPILVGASAAH